ncbi:MAG: hypothetical protein Fur0021_11060 [Candidatus Promineifilaceae bacterium]
MNPACSLSPAQLLPFFVYGTLLPGQPNAHLWGNAVAQMRPALFPSGRLYDMGNFPMLIAGNGRPIPGMLVEVKPQMYDPLIRRLDELEKYNPMQPQHSIYCREPHAIQAAPNQHTTAWVYVGRDIYVAGKPEILQADWPTYVAARLPDLQAWWRHFTSLFPTSPNK